MFNPDKFALTESICTPYRCHHASRCADQARYIAELENEAGEILLRWDQHRRLGRLAIHAGLTGFSYIFLVFAAMPGVGLALAWSTPIAAIVAFANLAAWGVAAMWRRP